MTLYNLEWVLFSALYWRELLCNTFFLLFSNELIIYLFLVSFFKCFFFFSLNSLICFFQSVCLVEFGTWVYRLLNYSRYSHMVRVCFWTCFTRLSYKEGFWSGWTLTCWLLGEHQSQVYLYLSCVLHSNCHFVYKWAQTLNFMFGMGYICTVYCILIFKNSMWCSIN